MTQPTSEEMFRDALETMVAETNHGITHEDFVSGVQARTMGFKCLVGEPSQLLSGARLGIFSFLVLLYMVVPIVLVPLWARHEGNWWLLGGILASAAGTFVATQRKQTSIGGLLFFAVLVSWFFLGFHSNLTFYLLSTLWGFTLFAMAESVQKDYALQLLVENQSLFEAAVAQKRIMIVRSFGDPAFKLPEEDVKKKLVGWVTKPSVSRDLTMVELTSKLTC